MFGYIAMTKYLIYYKSLVNYNYLADYASFIIKKVATEVIICFVRKEFAMYVNFVERFVALNEGFEFH